jgi:pimeloyl-ACP methyl ester carboxylesterase
MAAGVAVVVAIGWGVLATIPVVQRWIYRGEPSGESVRFIEWHRGQSTVAILFIHGLGGCAVPPGQSAESFCPRSAKDSFRSSSAQKSWPEMLAAGMEPIGDREVEKVFSRPLRTSDFGIYGVDYSRLTTENCPDMSIPEAASRIRELIERRLLRQYEHIIVVAHSMGGLIAKRMLLDSRTVGSRSALLESTIGLFWLGVPAQGSNQAPDPGITRFAMETIGADWWANVCSRQVKDLYAGDENTFLRDLEDGWSNLLGAVRFESAGKPKTYCAFEKVGEPIFLFIRRTIVSRSYALTQCSETPAAIGTYHTDLPKPQNTGSDVQLWLTGGLDRLMSEWINWRFVRRAIKPDDTFQTIADCLNSRQRAFVVTVDDGIKNKRPAGDLVEAPNALVLLQKLLLENPTVCSSTEWPDNDRARIRLRSAGACAP